MVIRAVGLEARLEFDAGKPDGTPRKLLDVSRLQALGWKASIPLETGIALTYRSFLAEHGGGRPGR
jgi:GDP-L-fucose synthase